MANKTLIIRNLKEKLEWLKENTHYNIAFICLQGSQNYSMDTKKSNVDAKCFIVPSLEDLTYNRKPISKIYTMSDNSQIDVKDIRLLPSLLYKSNPAYLEILFTDYFLTNNDYHRVPTLRLKKQLRNMRNEICNRDVCRFMKCLKGMVNDKRKHIEKETEANARDIELYGYAPKDLHHLLRYAYMIEEVNRLNKVNFQSLMSLDFLTKPKFNELKAYKTTPVHKADAMRLADLYYEKSNRLIHEFEEKNISVPNTDVSDRVYQYISEYIQFCIQRDVITEFVDNIQQKKLKEIERSKQINS